MACRPARLGLGLLALDGLVEVAVAAATFALPYRNQRFQLMAASSRGGSAECPVPELPEPGIEHPLVAEPDQGLGQLGDRPQLAFVGASSDTKWSSEPSLVGSISRRAVPSMSPLISALTTRGASTSSSRISKRTR